MLSHLDQTQTIPGIGIEVLVFWPVLVLHIDFQLTYVQLRVRQRLLRFLIVHDPAFHMVPITPLSLSLQVTISVTKSKIRFFRQSLCYYFFPTQNTSFLLENSWRMATITDSVCRIQIKNPLPSSLEFSPLLEFFPLFELD